MAEIEAYDPSRLMAAVRDRIKAEFIGLIPEATWTQMIQAEVDRFMKAGDSRSYHAPSGFTAAVQKELEEEVKRRTKEYLSSPEWNDHWATHGHYSTRIKDLLIENLPEVIAATFGGMMQGVIEQIKLR